MLIDCVDGTSLDKLSTGSKRRVRKKCDECGTISTVTYYDRMKSYRRSGGDYCHPCGTRRANCGDNNPAKRWDVRQKISQVTRGKSKTFKDGKDLRRLDMKMTTNGYILKYDDSRQKHVPEHRIVVEEAIGRRLTDQECVHHIDGEKTNNALDNLYLCQSTSKHSKVHKSLENIALELYRLGYIIFDQDTGQYLIDYSQLHGDYLELSLGFIDVAIKQKKNLCISRLDADTSSEIIRGVIRPIPMIASNMSTVVNPEFCIRLYELGALGIMHRADNPDRILSAVKHIAKKCSITAASIGVGKEQLDFAKSLIRAGANIITIDIAHGYSDTVIHLGQAIKKFSPKTKLILGNTICPDILYETYEFIDAIKVGIASGSACETKNTTGCLARQFSAVLKFKNIARKFNIPIISDGSIKEPSDVVKAIGAGASAVMAGSIFARCPESAAEEIDGMKIYAGMASRYVQDKWKGGLKPGTCPEGKVVKLHLGESVEKLLERYQGALRSGITYGGGVDIESFQDCVEFIRLAK